MTFLTAAIIQTRGEDVVCNAAGPDENGKHCGLIELHDNGEYDHLLISTEPVYESNDVALKAMNDIVGEVREMKL